MPYNRVPGQRAQAQYAPWDKRMKPSSSSPPWIDLGGIFSLFDPGPYCDYKINVATYIFSML